MARTSSRSPARASAPSTRRSNSPRAALAAPTDQEARKPPSCPGSGHAATLALYGRPRVALDGRPLTLGAGRGHLAHMVARGRGGGAGGSPSAAPLGNGPHG